MNIMIPLPSPKTRPTAHRRRVPTVQVMLLASLFPVVIVAVLASVVAFASAEETTTVPPTTDANNDDASPSCVSLSTSERDCLLTTTSNICEWIYDDDTGTTVCQEMVTTTTTTSTIILTNILPENYTYTRPPRNEIRYTPWNELSSELQSLATGSLRYTKLTWDTLGTNSIELLRYDDLSEDQKEAARELGFDDSFSWNCWQNHWEAFSWTQLDELQLTPYLTTLDWTSDSWNEQYSNPPITRQNNWSDLSIDQRLNATQLCYDRTSYDRLDIGYYGHGYPLPIPSLRFMPWKEIIADNNTTRLKFLQDTLGYDEFTWNVLRLAPVEQNAWHELTSSESNAVETLFGLDDAGWDCWINHYDSYSWADLMTSGIDEHFIGLGWSEASWVYDEGEVDPPASEKKQWHELNAVEQYHATELCFMQENWDRIDMTSNDGPFPYPKPKLRYTVWNELPSDKQQMAKSEMLYNETTWNDFGQAEIERKSWEDLSDYQQMAAVYLGMYDRTWDCFQNHYQATLWDDLPRNVTLAAITLGWDDYLWSGLAGGPPESYGRRWDQLSEEDKSAATFLCHSNISWPGDGSAIDLWDQYNDADTKSLTVKFLSPLVSLLVLMLSQLH